MGTFVLSGEGKRTAGFTTNVSSMRTMAKVRHWIGVASREHVRLGVKDGFAQFSHGKLAPARRPSEGDWVIYYSPKLKFDEAEPCQKFVAIGQVVDGEPFQVEQFPGFKPWRRKIRYEHATEVDIHMLIERLSFIKNKTKWGAAFRFGFFEIGKSDFAAIATRMRPRAPR